MFVTAWLALYDAKTRQLTYCSQGHPPAFLIRDGKIEDLFTQGIALGAQKLDAVTVKHILLRPQDLLFLYTDGIIEAHNPQGKMFGQKQLREFLLKTSEKSSSQQLVDGLLDNIHVYSQGTFQHDDMTLLSFRVIPFEKSVL